MTIQPPYRHIAARLAWDISTGRLGRGDHLPALRPAAALWRVNLHTVRKAYQVLDAAGLVRVRSRVPTVVLGGDGPGPSTLRGFLAACLDQAGRAFDATPAQVDDALRALTGPGPQVTVAECSRTLAGGLAAQLTRTWDLHATPSLMAEDWPRDRPVVSTWFHARQLRRRFPSPSADLHLLRIQLAPRLLQAVAERVRSGAARGVILCETDPSLAVDLAAELRSAAGGPVAIQLPPDPVAFLATVDRRTLTLLSPRHWDRLPADRRALPDVLPLEYDVEPSDLAALGPRLGVRRRLEQPAPLF